MSTLNCLSCITPMCNLVLFLMSKFGVVNLKALTFGLENESMQTKPLDK